MEILVLAGLMVLIAGVGVFAAAIMSKEISAVSDERISKRRNKRN